MEKQKRNKKRKSLLDLHCIVGKAYNCVFLVTLKITTKKHTKLAKMYKFWLINTLVTGGEYWLSNVRLVMDCSQSHNTFYLVSLILVITQVWGTLASIFPRHRWCWSLRSRISYTWVIKNHLGPLSGSTGAFWRILVCLSCYNKISYAGWGGGSLDSRHLCSHGSRGWKV